MSNATDRGDALRMFRDLAGRLIDDGYGREEIFEMLGAALDDLLDAPDTPYAPRNVCQLRGRHVGLERVPVGATGAGAVSELRETLVNHGRSNYRHHRCDCSRGCDSFCRHCPFAGFATPRQQAYQPPDCGVG